MRKMATAVFVSIYACTSISASAGPVRRALTTDSLPRPETIDDCISEYQVSDTALRVATKSGRSLEIVRGENGKVELVTQNGKAYRPIYNESQTLAAFKSLDDGVEHPVLSDSDTVPPEVEERLKQVIESVKPCAGTTLPAPTDRNGETCLPQIFFDRGGLQWYSEFGSPGYWQRLHQPYFDAEMRWALDRTAQRTCLIRYTACIDACQRADDIRGYSCAAFALIFISLPVGAAIGAAACLYGSNRERNQCTNSCGVIVDCF